MAADQLELLTPVEEQAPHWAHEGEACTSCDGGRYYLVHASDPCTCSDALCRCLAEGYARCDSCGALRQVWPREMVTTWAAAPGSQREPQAG